MTEADFKCERCGAAAGELCVTSAGNPAAFHQPRRRALWEAKRAGVADRTDGWPLTVDMQYGAPSLLCGGYVLYHSPATGRSWPQACRMEIGGSTLAEIREYLVTHLASGGHVDRGY